jgi:hypothetical protein
LACSPTGSGGPGPSSSGSSSGGGGPVRIESVEEESEWSYVRLVQGQGGEKRRKYFGKYFDSWGR